MMNAFALEYDQHLIALYVVLADAGVRLYTADGGPAHDPSVIWCALRPAMRVLRVSHAWQRRLEQRLAAYDTAKAAEPCIRLHWDGTRTVLLGGHRALTEVMHHSGHPACTTFSVWYTRALVTLMHHGTYNPATHHAPRPGEELDALERKTELQDLWRQCFPWWDSLPRYTITKDAEGNVIAVEPVEPPDPNAIPTDPEKGYDPDAIY